ncbi:MAG: hypothetical protein AAF667_08505 [Pseudomonadota bacterium]
MIQIYGRINLHLVAAFFLMGTAAYVGYADQVAKASRPAFISTLGSRDGHCASRQLKTVMGNLGCPNRSNGRMRGGAGFMRNN